MGSRPRMSQSGTGTRGSRMSGPAAERNKPVERAAAGIPVHEATAPVEMPERPALAHKVELVGELQGTGFADRQWLLQRDGQFVQVTELLYRLAEQANGERTHEEIAEKVTQVTDWAVTADDVRQLVQTKLIQLGLIYPADGLDALHRNDGGPL